MAIVLKANGTIASGNFILCWSHNSRHPYVALHWPCRYRSYVSLGGPTMAILQQAPSQVVACTNSHVGANYHVGWAEGQLAVYHIHRAGVDQMEILC